MHRILLYNSGGGLGDSIQLIPLILSLQKYFKNSEFFYLSAHENHYLSKLKDYGIKIQTLDLGIKYFGFRWWHLLVVKKKFKKLNIGNFDLVIDLQSKIRNTVILKKIPTKKFYSSTFNFFFCTKGYNSNNFKNTNKKNNSVRSTIYNLKNFLNKDFPQVEYEIASIPKIFHNEALKLLPNNNYVGFSLTQGNVYRKKEWPIDNIINLCSKIKIKNKIPVFFIEKNNKDLKKKIEQLIPDSLFPEHETELSSPALVTCLGKRLDFAISIDNGIMHMLSLAKVPMIVLFGPTKSEKFAPNYKNIIILDSKKIKNSSNIKSINVEDVLEAARQHLSF